MTGAAGDAEVVAIRLEAASAGYQPLNAFAIGLLVLPGGVHGRHHDREVRPEAAGVVRKLGELPSELFKLGALLVFGALICPAFLAESPEAAGSSRSWRWLLHGRRRWAVSFLGSGLNMREQMAPAWFGPKGFAAVVYGLLVLES